MKNHKFFCIAISYFKEEEEECVRLYGGCGENKIRSECDDRSINRSEGQQKIFSLGEPELRAASAESCYM